MNRQLFVLVLLTGTFCPTLAFTQDQAEVSNRATTLLETLDLDHNAALSESELIAAAGELNTSQLRQRLLVFDADRNGELSLTEWLRVPGLIANTERGDIPDPLQERCSQIIDALLLNVSVPVPASELESKWRSALPETVPLQVEYWDLNQDGNIDAAEARRGLEIAYGLRRADGHAARDAKGFVFNGSYFQHLDENGDGHLSQAELTTRYHAGKQAAVELLQSADLNPQDLQLSLAEIDAGNLFRSDMSNWFLKWDTNFDGAIDRTELSQGEAWQLKLAAHVIPAFDQDGDQRLSLDEFRCCPLANPLLNWTAPRVDRSGDASLSLDEFLKGQGLCCSGLAAWYFDQFDLNHDHRLDRSEFEFEIDTSKFNHAELFALLDRDHDQKLSLLELFSLPGTPLKTSEHDLLISNQRDLFQLADEDRDGSLNLAEFGASADVYQAAELAAQLERELLSGFLALDQDQDRQLSLAEARASESNSQWKVSRQEFVMGDADGNGNLSFSEFASLPAVSSVHRRPAVADPVRDVALRLANAVHQSWPSGAASLSGLDALKISQPHCAYVTARDVLTWDFNHDGQYSFAEVQSGILIAYGLQTSSRQKLHRLNGQVFNLRTFHDADADHNSRLSRSEFALKYWKQGRAADEDFQRADINSDGQLTLPELLHGNLFWVDLQQEFMRFDEDGNGTLSKVELYRNAQVHEKRMATWGIPAFDLNGDEELSFAEYRLSPLGNPLHDYDARRWDTNFDGQISLEEFHRAPEDRQLLGLSTLFFDKLDRNRDGQLAFTEFKFSADLKRIPVAAVFGILDLNGDDRLELSELLQREKPRDQSEWAKRNSEQRSMELEDAFLAADTDRNRVLSLAEFSDEQSSIRGVVVGLSSVGRTKASVVAGSFWRGWRWWSMIGANLFLFVAAGWWQYRKMAD